MNNVTWRDRTFDIEFVPSVDMRHGEPTDVQYQLRNSGDEALLDCQLELITPRDKIQLVKYEKILKAIPPGESASLKVTFVASSYIVDTTATLQFKCIETQRKLIR
ncbi:unnamed protein product [Gongylonema pulchrum]|uniref:MSP domain-containing protein n=1 Tax=Gongylonema pulchrum TaxID=637853 RepID=A0A3P6SY69_9BILA|nr:unnamed protein product [Gongylonema pulchrum]